MSGDRRLLAVVAAATVLILAVVNLQIAGKERILRDGTTVLLALAPRDPRSLLQGDYMALRYSIADDVASAAREAGVADGVAIVVLDSQGVASFLRLDDGEPLASGEHRLRFRKRGDAVRLATDAFFFEEGTAERYSDARFGELRVNAAGSAVLVGLRSADTRPLTP